MRATPWSRAAFWRWSRRRGRAGVVVDVIDTGHGIAPEHLSRIYDPFFTTKSAKKGTGLGLSVTYGIIQEHGGAIEAISRPGEGTCFRLEFPPRSAKRCMRDDGRRATETAAPPKAASL